jgi:hypothetical protein
MVGRIEVMVIMLCHPLFFGPGRMSRTRTIMVA